jgi:hypothetical protein
MGMTNSSNLYKTTNEAKPEHPIDTFYTNNECKTIDEKINALRRQLQQFPNNQLPKEEQLNRLETDFYKMIQAQQPDPAYGSRGGKDAYKDAYAQVNDTPIDMGNGSMTKDPVLNRMNNFLNFEKSYD